MATRKKIIDFGEFIEKSTADFVGRRWVRTAVDDFLKAASPRCFLLLGEPGCGKTAFAADLIKRRGYPHHFIGLGSQTDQRGSLDWRDPVRFAESVGYQLVCDYGGWIMSWEDWGISVKQEVTELEGLLTAADVESFKATPRPADKPVLTVEQRTKRFGPAAAMIGVYIENFQIDVEGVVRQLLMIPLRNIAQRWPHVQIVVVVDGLDEAEYYSDPLRNIFKLLPNSSLPGNVRFVLASDPGEHLTSGFKKQTQTFWMSEDETGKRDPRTIQDAADFVSELVREESVAEMLARNRIKPELLAEKVAAASQGNFLYLHHYATGLREGDEALLDLKVLPSGLSGIYADFLAKIKERREDVLWDAAYKPVLGTLAVAREALPPKRIAGFSQVKRGTVGTILQTLRQFLDSVGSIADRRFRIYHRSFGKWLISDENLDYIDGQEAHHKIVDYFHASPIVWDAPYAFEHLMAHMIAAHSWESLRVLLTDIDYLQKKQSPAQQYRFQKDFTELLLYREIPTSTLTEILRAVLAVLREQLETGNQKADWLDIFAYWMNEFGRTAPEERRAALKEVAEEFDHACAEVSKELAESNLAQGELDWSLRFAELATWVYQRSEDYANCIQACEYAERLCTREEMPEAYRLLGRAEFLRMRAAALRKLARAEEAGEESDAGQVREVYKALNRVLTAGRAGAWELTEEDWQMLEEDKLPTPPRLQESTSRAQVVSNAHDCVSAIYIIQHLQSHGAAIEWRHPKGLQPDDLAPKDTAVTVLIGGPKAPGISNVAEKFYEADRKGFLELYSAQSMVARVLKAPVGDTLCCMAGGPSKINTLMAAHQLTQDPEVVAALSRRYEM